jgi:GT2 family glycosyltransferase
MKAVAGTIIATNYLGFARALANSFIKFENKEFYVLILDPGENTFNGEAFNVVYPSDLNISPYDFDVMKTIYDVSELSTALKPWFLEYLFTIGADSALYLDPDTLLFSDLSSYWQALSSKSIVLTAHVTDPLPQDNLRPSDSDIMMSGIFNLGTIGLTKSTQVFLEFWKSRLKRHCISDPTNQLFVDQRWIDYVPALFDFYALEDPTINVAYWNLHGRPLKYENGTYYIEDQPLRLFHFSGYDPSKPDFLNKYFDKARVRPEDNQSLLKLLGEYGLLLAKSGHGKFAGTQYGFSKSIGGIKLDKAIRRLFRDAYLAYENGQSSYRPPNPFQEDEQTAFESFLNEKSYSFNNPLESCDEGVCLTNYFHSLWKNSPDLRDYFGEPLSGGTRSFLNWMKKYASQYDERLLAGIRRTNGLSIYSPNRDLRPVIMPAKIPDYKADGCVHVIAPFYSDSAASTIAGQFIKHLETDKKDYIATSFEYDYSKKRREYLKINSGDKGISTNIIFCNANLLAKVLEDFFALNKDTLVRAKNVAVLTGDIVEIKYNPLFEFVDKFVLDHSWHEVKFNELLALHKKDSAFVLPYWSFDYEKIREDKNIFLKSLNISPSRPKIVAIADGLLSEVQAVKYGEILGELIESSKEGNLLKNPQFVLIGRSFMNENFKKFSNVVILDKPLGCEEIGYILASGGLYISPACHRCLDPWAVTADSLGVPVKLLGDIGQSPQNLKDYGHNPICKYPHLDADIKEIELPEPMIRSDTPKSLPSQISNYFTDSLASLINEDKNISFKPAGKITLIIIPFYKNPELVGEQLSSLIAISDELLRLNCVIYCVNDSPGDPKLKSELEKFKTELSVYKIEVIIHEMKLNSGFVAAANTGLKYARDRNYHALLLNSDCTLTQGSLTEMHEVLGIDEKFGFVGLRSNDATIATLPFLGEFDYLNDSESKELYRRMRKFLARYQIVPTLPGSCLLIKDKVLQITGILDEVFSPGYNEENDYIMRANKLGYLVALSNKAYAYHKSSSSFGEAKNALEEKHQKIMQNRYPYFYNAVFRYEHGYQRSWERALSAYFVTKNKPRILLDLSFLQPHFSGTSELASYIVTALMEHEKFQSEFELVVFADPEMLSRHNISVKDLRIVNSLNSQNETYVVQLHLAQVFSISVLERSFASSLYHMYYFLDNIALDCLYLEEQNPSLRKLWELMAETSTSFAFLSNSAKENFLNRFERPTLRKDFVAYPSLKITDYKWAPEDFSATGLGDDFKKYILIVGNHFSHKRVDETRKIIRKEFPDLKIVSLGTEVTGEPNTVGMVSGLIEESRIRALYQHASVVVFPSNYEGFGFPIFRTLACNRPLLCRNTEVTRELLSQAFSKGIDDLPIKLVNFESEWAEYVGKLLHLEPVDYAINQGQVHSWSQTADAFYMQICKILDDPNEIIASKHAFKLLGNLSGFGSADDYLLLRERIKELEESTSWKVTKPLRKLTGLLKKYI